MNSDITSTSTQQLRKLPKNRNYNYLHTQKAQVPLQDSIIHFTWRFFSVAILPLSFSLLQGNKSWNLVVKSDRVFLKVSSVQISVMSAMIIRFFQQFFDANSNHESSNSPPKARNEIANIWMLVDSRMISPRFKPCPRIFSHLQVLSRGIHLLEGRENWVNFTEIFATSPIEKLRLVLRNQASWFRIA